MANAANKDYYKILGVGENASDEEIKSAFHQLARRFHPDANPGSAGAEARFKEINEAYSVLADPDKRREYDAGVSRPAPTSQEARRPGRPPYTYRPGVAPGSASARFSNARDVRFRQAGSPGKTVADLNVRVAGLSLGLRIADGLLGGLSRLVSSENRGGPPRRPPPGARPPTDRKT